MFGLPYTILAPKVLMLDSDKYMLVDHRAGESMKLMPTNVFKMAAILDGQKYDLNRKWLYTVISTCKL